MPRILFEYIAKDKDGDVYVLTEKQKDVLIENGSKRFIEFPLFAINPAYIVNITKRPAESLKDMYPCEKCNTNGYLVGQPRDEHGQYPQCPECEGTGVKLP